MRKILALVLVAFVFSALSANAEECAGKRYIVGLASEKGTVVQVYCLNEISLQTRFADVSKVPGFENCELARLVGVYYRLTCGEKTFNVNTTKQVGTCEYHGVHRVDGLGFRMKATWDVWARAAEACGEKSEKVAEYRTRMTDHFWAGNDLDPRYTKK